MLFNSYEFIFIFLPITLIGYFAIGRIRESYAALFLALASLLFYGWWNVRYIPLLLFSITANYTTGLLIAKSHEKQNISHAKKILISGITFNLLLLAYYKYTNFFLDNINRTFNSEISIEQIILPLGISFFTFTQIAFLVDAFRKKVHEYNFTHYLLFVTYFPHLIAGPILHHSEMMPQFSLARSYRPDLENFSCGITIFFIGLFKKTVIADSLATYATPVFAAADSGSILTFYEAWGGALAYTLQLYFDFSGYCDMAIGISWLFGIRLPINFNSPYKAISIIDFWRRWHITLSRFLRDYLYFFLGGNRLGKGRRHINLITTMLLGGLWHGAGWTFIIWGLLHGIYLTTNHIWRQVSQKRDVHLRLSTPISILLTFTFVVIGWVFFRASSINGATSMLRSMFFFNGLTIPNKLIGLIPAEITPIIERFGISFGSTGNLFQSPEQILWIFGSLLICWFFPNSQEFLRAFNPGTEPVITAPINSIFLWVPNKAWALAISIIAVTSLMFTDRVSEFLYFQF